MGCGANVSKKRFEEAEIRATQLESSLRKQEAELRRLEGAEASKTEDRGQLIEELEQERLGRSGAEDALEKALAQIKALEKEVVGLEEAASAEASRSSRLDGRCSALMVESRSLHDEIATFTASQQQFREAEQELRAELRQREEELTRLHQQLRDVSDETADYQAQRDYAYTELKAANQVAEALKSAAAAMEAPSTRRRKPRRSKTLEETASQGEKAFLRGGFQSESDAGGSVAASEASKAEEVRPRRRDSVKTLQQSSKKDALQASVGASPAEEEPKRGASPQDTGQVPIPDVPWADSPDVAPVRVQAFGFDKAVEGPLSPVQEEAARAGPLDAGASPETSQEPAGDKAEVAAVSAPHTNPAAKVFQFDFSVFDFLKHEALATPPDSPVPGLLPAEQATFSSAGHPVVFPPRSPEKAPERPGASAAGTLSAKRFEGLDASHEMTRREEMSSDQALDHALLGVWGDAGWGAADSGNGNRWTARA